MLTCTRVRAPPGSLGEQNNGTYQISQSAALAVCQAY